MAWFTVDEIRSPEELLPPPVELSDEEIDGALALMDTMTCEDLEGEESQDTYTEALSQIIEASGSTASRRSFRSRRRSRGRSST
ncbi:Ku family protein [Streptomyces swartbergensis]|uniref:hypothetical protein n=1 Tax=Streptomyces swartbergensis TaxID=487165 RepID=UPI003820144A